PGVRISRRDHPGSHAALHDAATEPSLHWRHARKAPGRPGRPEKGGRHRDPQRLEPKALVEAWGMASPRLNSSNGALKRGETSFVQRPEARRRPGAMPPLLATRRRSP